MKLISFRRGSALRAGAVSGDWIIDLGSAARALKCGALASSLRAILEEGTPGMTTARKTVLRAETKLRTVERKRERRPTWALPMAGVEFAPPVPDPEKIICIGQNYLDHCREQGVEPPKTPIFFSKYPPTLIGPRGEIVLPPPDLTNAVDYEVELAFVIGRHAKRVAKSEAMNYVAGYMVMNDVSARDAQFGDKQWDRAKSFDTFGPCGPWLLTADEIADPHRLRLWLKLNGATMQDSSTGNMIAKIPDLIAYISRGLTLRPGDIVSTGTPPGVGFARKPPVFLKPGDVVEAGIEGIGTICNRVVREP